MQILRAVHLIGKRPPLTSIFSRTMSQAPPVLKALTAYSYSEVLSKHYPNVPRTPLFIDGKHVQSTSDLFIPVHNPTTQEIVTFVPQATPEECAAALASSQAAFQKWRNVSILTRQKVMLELQKLIRDDMDTIAAIIMKELGKTKVDAKGDVLRGLRKPEITISVFLFVFRGR